MPKLPKRKLSAYKVERERLMAYLSVSDPKTDDYATVLNRVEQLDQILKRSGELSKTLIPAGATALGLVLIYGFQQSLGLLPKAVDMLVSRPPRTPPD